MEVKMDNNKTTRRRYEAPMLEVYAYEAEHGFADSIKGTPMYETFSEITDSDNGQAPGSGTTGENYHGEWY